MTVSKSTLSIKFCNADCSYTSIMFSLLCWMSWRQRDKRASCFNKLKYCAGPVHSNQLRKCIEEAWLAKLFLIIICTLVIICDISNESFKVLSWRKRINKRFFQWKIIKSGIAILLLVQCFDYFWYGNFFKHARLVLRPLSKNSDQNWTWNQV